MMDYRNCPSLADQSLTQELERISAQLSKEYGKALNTWLQSCVEAFCPQASDAVKNGKLLQASAHLNSEDLYYAVYPDHRVEFRQGDKVLASAKFEINFRVGQLEPPST